MGTSTRLILCLFVSISELAWGKGSISSETVANKDQFSESLSGQGEVTPPSDPDERSDIFTWNLGLTRSKYKSTDSVSGTDIEDNTTEVRLGGGYEPNENWNVGLGFTYSATPEESLRNYGPSLYAEHIWNFKKNEGLDDDDDDDDFTPSVYLRGSIDVQNYDETATTNTIRRTRIKGNIVANSTAVRSVETIRQSAFSAEVGWSPLEWFSTYLSYTKYNYDRDVAAFLNALDSAGAVGGGNFTSTLGGFPRDSGTLGVSFYMGDAWTFDSSATLEANVVDSSLLYSYRNVLSYRFQAPWKVGLGYRRDISPGVDAGFVIADIRFRF